MRKLSLALTVAAAAIGVTALANRADASVLMAPHGLASAAEAVDVTDQVHCRPGRWHHRYRPHDGCFRRYRGAYYGGPYYGRRYYGGFYGPYYGRRYYGGPYIAGPGFSFGFAIGPRRHWGW